MAGFLGSRLVSPAQFPVPGISAGGSLDIDFVFAPSESTTMSTVHAPTTVIGLTGPEAAAFAEAGARSSEAGAAQVAALGQQVSGLGQRIVDVIEGAGQAQGAVAPTLPVGAAILAVAVIGYLLLRR